MIDKALLIMIFMWSVSFVVLGVHWSIFDVMHITPTIQCSDGCAEYGQPLKPIIVGWLNGGNFNEITLRASQGAYTNSDQSAFDKVLNFSTAAAHVGWDLVLLLTGVYIFSLVYYVGVPIIFVSGITMIYYFFLIRAIVGYIRGV